MYFILTIRHDTWYPTTQDSIRFIFINYPVQKNNMYETKYVPAPISVLTFVIPYVLHTGQIT